MSYKNWTRPKGVGNPWPFFFQPLHIWGVVAWFLCPLYASYEALQTHIVVHCFAHFVVQAAFLGSVQHGGCDGGPTLNGVIWTGTHQVMIVWVFSAPTLRALHLPTYMGLPWWLKTSFHCFAKCNPNHICMCWWSPGGFSIRIYLNMPCMNHFWSRSVRCFDKAEML